MTGQGLVLLFKKDSRMTNSQWHRFCKRYIHKDTSSIVKLVKQIYADEDIKSTKSFEDALKEEMQHTCRLDEECLIHG